METGRSRENAERSIAHSFSFGAFASAAPIGLRPAGADFTMLGYLADIFVIPAGQGHRVAKGWCARRSSTLAARACGGSCCEHGTHSRFTHRLVLSHRQIRRT
jgi:hypothetical protein